MADEKSKFVFSDYEDMETDESETSDILEQLNEEDDDSSSEEEVFPIHSNSDSSDSEQENLYNNMDDGFDISGSDINDEDDDLPDPKAWGKKKKRYYNADNINDKINTLNEENEEAAKLEEEEARAIQKRLVSEIDDADLTIDLLAETIAEKKEEENKEEDVKIDVDLSALSESEKLALLNKECPELLTYIEDYKRLMLCTRDELLPVIKILKSNKLNKSEISQFLQLYYQLIMNYCVNITFYVLMKTQKTNSRSHPCINWISQYKNMLRKVEKVYDNLYKSQVKSIMLRGVKSQLRNRREKQSKSIIDSRSVSVIRQDDHIRLNGDSVPFSEDNEILEEDAGTEGKRPITYEMAKNKGLTPHRKKELRNPRVKHRIKYRKAKIRRKGQVREVRRELKKYGGEISGIKAGVVKSIKFKA